MSEQKIERVDCTVKVAPVMVDCTIDGKSSTDGDEEE